MSAYQDDDYDLNRIIIRPLYFGLLANIVVPVALLFVCYYINNRGPRPNALGDASDMVFYIFLVLAVAECGLAIWWRTKLFKSPMIRTKETFERDFSDEYLRRSRPLFILIASISIYGYIYFYLTGQFNAAAWFVVGSFLVFQLVRPRHGLVRKLIDHQKQLVEKGQFLQS
ncbi:hypothetical protein C3F09_04210 [candidate division GN15 bacterium]|uniref:Uncharacterized protein n=1 Tax=candidate division GN15 bacterium TaxID=2072418 RepID=A0A855X8B0_9BACT|nr:MAG: hypothetical protein C3F09_04210 [candidate division GN15 bacterium]